eukprot:TRINITY_DN579_c0_g1_i12.p1 TRINITY_DN579_c0_g1~~TRINITY_DN579_c0_g1_i12.p1  ORF type:complete len:198 (-),score=36.77 TRINITY_DN579_c0_g1_i12:172-765(-)
MISILLLSLIAFSIATDPVTLTAANYNDIVNSGKHVFIFFNSECGCGYCPYIKSPYILLPTLVADAKLDVIIAMVDICEYVDPALDFEIFDYPNLVLHRKDENKKYCLLTTNATAMVEFLKQHVPVIEDDECNSEARGKGTEVVAEKHGEAPLDTARIKEEYDIIREYRKYVIGLVVLLVWAVLFIICSTVNKKANP